MKPLWSKRLSISLAIAIVCGTYIGIAYSYPSLFGGGDLRIYPLLIWPSVLIGIISGWKTVFICPYLHAYVAIIFFARALIRPELWWEYVVFVFHLTFGGVATVFPYSFAWSCAGALLSWIALMTYRKIKGPNQPVEATTSLRSAAPHG